MGIYDRDYERGGHSGGYGGAPGYQLGKPQTMTVKLMVVTGAVYAAQLLFPPTTVLLALSDRWFEAPWQVYQLVTYGFLHSERDLWHILFNMYGLWLFGRDVEGRYGSREFLVFYLAAVAVAGVTWWLCEMATPAHSVMVGASGGVAAVMIAFAVLFPHRKMLLMFLFPMPMWTLAVLIVGIDALGAMNRSGSVAYTAHLGGVAFGLAYYRFGWRLSSWLPTRWKMPRLRRRPPLRAHDPSADKENDDTEVDDILRKIREHGQDSLSRHERRVLEQASREFQKRKS